MIKLRAFTMAEVLITLGIIGIVAAITLPSLIGNYQKKQTAIQLKKFYSIMQQAIATSELQNGEVKYWDFKIGGNKNTEIFANTYLTPYLKIIKTYMPEDFPADIHYKCVNGKNCDSYGEVKNNNPKLVLADGTMILATDYFEAKDINNNTISAINIIVDINGFKKPNQYGLMFLRFQYNLISDLYRQESVIHLQCKEHNKLIAETGSLQEDRKEGATESKTDFIAQG